MLQQGIRVCLSVGRCVAQLESAIFLPRIYIKRLCAPYLSALQSHSMPSVLNCRERVRKIALERDGVVLVTLGTFSYLDFVLNWRSHLLANNVTTYMIGCLDRDLLQASFLTSQWSCLGSFQCYYHVFKKFQKTLLCTSSPPVYLS